MRTLFGINSACHPFYSQHHKTVPVTLFTASTTKRCLSPIFLLFSVRTPKKVPDTSFPQICAPKTMLVTFFTTHAPKTVPVTLSTAHTSKRCLSLISITRASKRCLSPFFLLFHHCMPDSLCMFFSTTHAPKTVPDTFFPAHAPKRCLTPFPQPIPQNGA